MTVSIEERCPTGISGFDKLVQGGFPRGRTILVSGEAGSGKTIFSIEFLCKGAEKYNEPGILVTLEQSPGELKRDVSVFNFDLEKLEAEGKIVIIDASLSKLSGAGGIPQKVSVSGKIPVTSTSFALLPGETSMGKLTDVVIRVAKKIKAKRVILDSVPALDFMIGDQREVRRLLLNMVYKLKEIGLTTILITEQSEYRGLITSGIESYVADGVISLHFSTRGEDAGRTLIIKKMRSSSHSENIHPIKFVEGKGIEVMEV